MDEKRGLDEIEMKVRVMKEMAEELSQMAGDLPFLSRNLARIRASLKMIELNVSDLAALDSGN